MSKEWMLFRWKQKSLRGTTTLDIYFNPLDWRIGVRADVWAGMGTFMFALPMLVVVVRTPVAVS